MSFSGMEHFISFVILLSVSVLPCVDGQRRSTTSTSTSTRRPPPRNTTTTSSTTSSTIGISTETTTVSLVFTPNNDNGILSTEAVISLYCLIAVLLIIIVVIAILFAIRKYKKKKKRVRFTRNMQSNYVMYGEHDENDMHSYTNPNFRFCGDDDNDYTEIQVEHMVKLKSVRARSFRTLSCKLSQSEDKATHTNTDVADDTEDQNNVWEHKGNANIINMRNKDGHDGVREDSSGYLVPGSDFADDDDVFVDTRRGKDEYLEIKTVKIAGKQVKS